MRTLACYSIKGGVGKTTAAVNLGYLAALDGARTLLWDLDPQGAASYCLRIKPKLAGGAKKLVRKRKRVLRHVRGTDYEGLDLLPADFSHRHLDLYLADTGDARGRFRELLAPLADEYDVVLLDCAPSISIVSEGVFEAADALLVPSLPSPMSLRTLEQLQRYLRKAGLASLPVLPFLSMVDRRRRLHREVCDQADEADGPFLVAKIPYASAVEQMSVRREPLVHFAPGSIASLGFAALWREVQALLG